MYVRIWFSNIHTKLYQVHKDLYTCIGNNYEKSLKAYSNRSGKWGKCQSIYLHLCLTSMCVCVFAGCQTSSVENG